MTDTGGAGAPDNGGQGTDATTDTGRAGTATAPATDTVDDWGADEWKAFAQEVRLTPADLRKKLDHARTWEQRAKENKAGADQAKTLQQQVEEMQKALAERDVREVERAGRLAMTQVRSGLAEAGIKADDVKELLDEIDPTRLLKDGEPNDEAIGRIVGALRRAAGRPTPDPDQGRSSAAQPTSMSEFMRQLREQRR